MVRREELQSCLMPEINDAQSRLNLTHVKSIPFATFGGGGSEGDPDRG